MFHIQEYMSINIEYLYQGVIAEQLSKTHNTHSQNNNKLNHPLSDTETSESSLNFSLSKNIHSLFHKSKWKTVYVAKG